MWMMLSLPILIIFCGGALATYGIMAALSIGVKIAVYAIFILIFLAITTGLICLIVIPYRGCETKIGKVIWASFVTFCLGILLYVVFSRIKTTNITVVNESKNEIITEITMVPISEKYNIKETKVFDYKTLGHKIRFTDEMTERCKKLGLKYKKGEEWFSLKGNEKYLVSGLWNSESYTFQVTRGTWIITLKTINRNTENFYSVIYNQNAFCTHLGETLSFIYSGNDILLTEHQKAKFMPEIINKHLQKESSKKFEPNLIVITKDVENVSSSLFIHDTSQFTTFPKIKIGNYDFYCLAPDKIYSVNYHFAEWYDFERKEVLKEDKKITINNDGVVLYLDENKKTIKQSQASGNYAKVKIEK